MGKEKKFDSDVLSNDVSNADQVLLVRLMEEAGELIQACSKTLRWGWDSVNPYDASDETNRRFVQRELGDVIDIAKRLKLRMRRN